MSFSFTARTDPAAELAAELAAAAQAAGAIDAATRNGVLEGFLAVMESIVSAAQVLEAQLSPYAVAEVRVDGHCNPGGGVSSVGVSWSVVTAAEPEAVGVAGPGA